LTKAKEDLLMKAREGLLTKTWLEKVDLLMKAWLEKVC
jgi:hypothetical protein